jgi:malonate-semialdehyde dehydrogenase (acetylating)/methylmalonate-semialdehyde dehydrogenase
VGDKAFADAFIEKFIASTKAMSVGDGLDEKNAMGPLISQAHRERVLEYIEKGIREGADLVLDGRDFTVDGYPNGFFVGPTIFDNVTPDMTIAKEEIFGPVVSIVRTPTLDDVLELINTRDFANAACIYTQDAAAVRKMRIGADPGMIGVNIGIAAPMSFFPFGGSQNSMFGDIKGHGRESFQFFTDTKVVIERYF